MARLTDFHRQHSPSPITMDSGHHFGPVYSSLPPHTVVPSLSWTATAPHGGPQAPDILYGGVDGTLFPSDMGATTGAALAPSGPPSQSDGSGQAILCFYKLEFPTYDILDFPLN
jgi:hypothetical protein